MPGFAFRRFLAIWVLALVVIESPRRISAEEVITSPSAAQVLSGAVNALRESHAKRGTIVLQSELDPLIAKGGGGSCPSCTAVNALQLLRVLAKREPLQNPHKVALDAFK